MEKIRILVVDDDEPVCRQVCDLLNGAEIAGCTILTDPEVDFARGKERLQKGDYDVVILDLYRGTPSEANVDLPGKEILEEIKKSVPIAVIFYTGLTTHIEDLRSEMVRVVSKSGGNIGEEVRSVIETGIPLIRKKLAGHLREVLRKYYWDFVDKHADLIHNAQDAALLEYLILRRLASTLTREGVGRIFGTSISPDKVHPLEFYVCPPLDESEFEAGDILRKEVDSSFHVVLTPSCDLAQGKADYILLASGIPLIETPAYKNYQGNQKDDNKENLLRLIESRKGDRYFFLPRNEFLKMPDLILDFQIVTNHHLPEFKGYKKIAKIDDPFAQDMLATFVRNKNRPGSPDLDSTHVLQYLDKELARGKSENSPKERRK